MSFCLRLPSRFHFHCTCCITVQPSAVSVVSYVCREVNQQKNTVLPARADERNNDVIELMAVIRAAVSSPIPIPVSHRFKVTRI